MTTPQDPGDTPQDPADPQNPYGTPPPPAEPPTTAIPPAPPVYGTEPPAAPAYGQPGYGAPQPGVPQYGAPQPGVPQYGAPPPGVPQYGMPPSDQPGKGMAITALVISFFGCVVIGALIAIPLAIAVLVRSKDGRNHGKGLAIAALVVSVVTLAIPVVGIVAGVSYVNSLTDVNDLREGDCLTATGLTDSDAESVTEIKTISCSESHDGQVLATVELTQDQADNYKTTPFAEFCDPAISAAGNAGLISETVTYTALTVADPTAGDHAACVAYHSDGSKLTAPLGG